MALVRSQLPRGCGSQSTGRHRRSRKRGAHCLLVALFGAGLASLLLAAATTAFGLGLASRVSNQPQLCRLYRHGDGRTSLPALPIEGAEEVMQAACLGSTAAPGLDVASFLVSFADQGQNINGILFQASLLPYVLFLYFLGYKGNNTPPLVLFGFTFLLAFVLATIPTGIISKSTYGIILADSDWLHGAAESLLTCTNILIVLGFRGAIMADKDLADNGIARGLSFVWLAAAAITIGSGIPVFNWEAHTPFLGGVGGLTPEVLGAAASEPVNALSLPTWIVHWSSVFEFLFAMELAWRYAESTGNPKWKGLTWGMFPSHISSVAALTFHVFYNGIPWILTAQAAFTLIGNTTLCIAASRIAISNGWTLSELNPFAGAEPVKDGEKTEAEAKVDSPPNDGFDVNRLNAAPNADMLPGPVLTAEIIIFSLVFSYATKYGELAVGSSIFQSPDSSLVAALFLILPPCLVLSNFYSKSSDLQAGTMPSVLVSGATGTNTDSAAS